MYYCIFIAYYLYCSVSVYTPHPPSQGLLGYTQFQLFSFTVNKSYLFLFLFSFLLSEISFKLSQCQCKEIKNGLGRLAVEIKKLL
jgi:hypothetical protein